MKDIFHPNNLSCTEHEHCFSWPSYISNDTKDKEDELTCMCGKVLYVEYIRECLPQNLFKKAKYV